MTQDEAYASHLEQLRAIERERSEKMLEYLAEVVKVFTPSPRSDSERREFLAACALSSGHCRSTLPDYDLTALFGDRSGIRREEIIAAEAYRIADAMLARSSPHP